MSDEGRCPPAHQEDPSTGNEGDAATAQLIRQVSHYLRFFNITHEAIICVDEKGRIVAFNQGAEKLFGYPHQDILGSPADQLICQQFRSEKKRRLMTLARIAMENRFGFTTDRIICRRNNRERFTAEVSMSQTSLDNVRLFTLSVRDISKQLEHERELAYQAEHDVLTDLPNRALLDDRLQAGIARATRYHRKLGLVYIDLDNFKPVNDRYGHEAGDCLLKAIARRLEDTMRQSDTVCRLGGDEFIICLEQINNADAAVKASHKIIAALGQPFQILGMEINTSVSIGIAMYPEHGKDAETLLRHADEAMYRAKENRESPQVYRPHNQG